MKKIFYIIVLLIGFFGNSQTPFPTGIRLPNATLSDTLSTQTRIPIMQHNSGNLITKYTVIDSLPLNAPLTTTPDSLLIYTPQKRAAHIPFSDFKAKLNMPFIAVDEGNGIGYRIRTIDTSRVGNIGSNSIDFGAYGTPSSTAGPTGDWNFTAIGTNTIPGVGNAAFGNLINITSAYNFSTGYWNYIGGNTTGDGYHFSAGRGNNIGGGLGNMLLGTALSQNNGFGVVVLGTANVEVPATASFSNSNPVLIVGNGTHSTSSNTDWNSTAVRKNLLVGYRSGLIVAPSLTKTLIDADTTGRALVTKEWVLTAIDTIGGGAVSSVNGQTGDVVLDADDISDTSTTNKFVTSTEKGLIGTALQPSAISNEAYNASTWDGVDTIAPSKNAVRDKFDSIDLILNNVVTTNTNQSISGTKTMTGGLVILADGTSNSDALIFQGNMPSSFDNVTGVNIFRKNNNLALTLDAGLTNRIALLKGTSDFTAERTFTLPDKSGTIALLDDISGGGATQISADSVFVSPTIKGYGNAYALLEAHQTSIDSIQGAMEGKINTAFRTVSSTSGVFTEAFNNSQPNFQLSLDEDVEVEITDAVNGDFLIAEIVNPEDEPFLVTFIDSDKEYLIEGGETAVFSMITNANDETIWIKSILEDAAYKEISATGSVDIDFKNYDFIKLNVEDENYLEFINPRKNVANLTLHLENKEGVPYDIHFPNNTLFKTLGQGATIELGSDKLGVFKFDYRDGGFICTSYDVEYDIPVTETYTIVRRVNTGSLSNITATDGFIDWQNGFGGGAGGPSDNLTVTAGNNLATTSVTWTRHSSIPSSMPDADFQTLFDSERWDEAGAPEMKYTFSSMTAGTYKVRIYMGESNNTATVGTRVFDIKIQGNTVDTIDMVDRFGDNEVAGMVEYDNIIVSGTTLDVEWIHVTENPVVNGIEILKRD